MKRNLRYTAISKGLLTFGMAIGLSLSSGMAAAVGQITVATNDTVVETGEEFSAIVALNGDGHYDVYVGITGGVFGSDFQVFNADGALMPWLPAEGPPPKLRDNVDLDSLSVKDKIIRLLPRMPLDGYAGDYVIYAVLSAPGQFQQQLQDATLIGNIKKITDLKASIEKERILLMGKRSKLGIEFLHQLFKKPVVTIKDVQAMTGLSPKAANDLVKAFVKQRILVETTGYQRNRVFVFDEYVRMF